MEIRHKIIFDLDGTLIDINERWYKLHYDLAKQLKIPFLKKQQYINFKRQGVNEEKLITKCTDNQEIVAYYCNKRLALIESKKYLKCDLPKVDAIRKLNELGKMYDLFLTTRRQKRSNCVWEIKQLGLYRFFKEVAICKSFEDKQQATSKIIKKNNSKAVIIGDTKDDILIARKLKTACILISDGARDKKIVKKYNPNFLINNLRDLTGQIVKKALSNN